MRELFVEYCPLGQPAIQEIWASALIILDANILLNLYRYTDETREGLLEILESQRLSERLWLPFQAALEFHRNRALVIAEQAVPYQKIIVAIDKNTRNLLEELQSIQLHRYHPYLQKEELVNVTNNLKETLITHLKDKASAYPNFLSDDLILDRIHELFKGKHGSEPSAQRKAELIQLGEERFKAKLPPGYADEGKDGADKYGDFFLWREILDKAISQHKPVILVTDDLKEDWWYRIKGKTVGARPELRREFKAETGYEFLLYNPVEFAKYANQFIGQPDRTDNLLDEMNRLRFWRDHKKTLKTVEQHSARPPEELVDEENEEDETEDEGASVEEMVKWFYENYEDPANGVPYESAEGGYQYYAGGPYDPMEELQEQFPDVPFERIELATDQIYVDGSDWVKIDQY
jgi:PIN like domain